MNSQDIKELFALQTVLADVGVDSATPEVLAALLDWKNGGAAQVPKQEPAAAAKPPAKAAAKAKAAPPPPDDDDPGF